MEQARGLLQRIGADPEFAERLERALFDQKRTVLVEAGFGDLKLRCLSQALPESAGGEIPGRVIFDGSRHLGSRGRRWTRGSA